MAKDEGSPALPDGGDRRAAVTDFERNLVVLAGAGTGKTSLLVERFLNSIGSGRATVEQIAAITFTEKAAAEMRLRVADGLEELRLAALGQTVKADTPAARAFRHLREETGAAPAEIERRALAALEALDRSRVLTIHGFCSEILREHPIEAAVDPDFSVDTGERASTLAEAVWEEYLGEELGHSGERDAAWTELLGTLPLATIGTIVRALAGFRVPLALLDPRRDRPDARQLLGHEARLLHDEIAKMLERAGRLTPSYSSFLPRALSVLEGFLEQGAAPARRTIRDDPALVKRLDDGTPSAGKSLTGVSADEARETYRRARRFLRLLQRLDERLPQRLVEIAEPFARRVREDLLAHGWVGFDGLLALARDLLRDHPTVRRELKLRFRALLVDEFQDTDPLQYEIVLFLAEREDDSSSDPWTTRLQPGKLFVVGDPKQSIYRFRGADYAAFHAAVAHVLDQGGRRLDLTANFRSVPGITEPINLLFEEGRSHCWRESAFQPAYETIQAVRRDADASPRVELWTLGLPEGAGAPARRRLEGRQIAATIEQLVRDGACRHRDLAILFRTFSSIPYYLRPLRERGIPFVVDGGKEFLKRPEISQSLAALRTLAQPGDPVALLAFLRSPAGGVRDTELAAYAALQKPWDWRVRVEGAGIERIAHCFGLLRRLERAARRLPVDARVRLVMEKTCLFPLAAAAYEGPQRVANLQKLSEAARRLARDGRLSLEEVVDVLQEGGLADLETDSPLADDRAEAVRITSIHKMKGLESEWVLLPDLAREDAFDRNTTIPVEIVRHPEHGRALALHLDRERVSPAWALHELDREQHEEAEETRVLYVALTRARERLILVAGRSRSTGRFLRALGAWGYDVSAPPEPGATLAGGLVRHVALTPLVGAPEPPPEIPPGAERAVADYALAAAEARRRSFPPFRAPSAAGPAEPGQAHHGIRAPRSRRPREFGIALGRATHQALQAWDGADTSGLGLELERACRDVAADLGVDLGRLEREAREVLERFLASALGPRFRRVERLGREVPLLLRDELRGDTYRGSIDLLYRDEDGRLVVADYKTDDEPDPAVLVARYGEQLRVYARAVERALEPSTPPRAELWMLRTGARVVIEP